MKALDWSNYIMTFDIFEINRSFEGLVLLVSYLIPDIRDDRY